MLIGDGVRRACVQEEEEIQSLQKTISQMEAELDEEQNRLAEATTKLENSEKQLQKVSRTFRRGDVAIVTVSQREMPSIRAVTRGCFSV